MYEGQFEREKFDGVGKMSYARGEGEGGEHEGQWRRGLAHGKGRRTTADGTFVEGYFSHGQPHGTPAG